MLRRFRIPHREPQRVCILDGCGPVYIDTSYRDLGLSEGWLVHDGWFYDSEHRVVITYRHVTP